VVPSRKRVGLRPLVNRATFLFEGTRDRFLTEPGRPDPVTISLLDGG
jgi:hypothetical protein